MPYSSNAGIAIATQDNPNTFYQLTDHNRQPINFDYEIIERSARMANGTMRKFVVAKKMKISTSWRDLPSGTGTGVVISINCLYSSRCLDKFNRKCKYCHSWSNIYGYCKY